MNAEDKPQCSLPHQNKIIQDLRNRSTDGGDFIKLSQINMLTARFVYIN